jgi:DNA-directed RNA polymerase specialized sigma24 family protein
VPCDADLADVFSLNELLLRFGAETPFADAIAERETLSVALADLGPNDAACLLINVAHGFTAREIAAMLEITPAAAKKRLTRLCAAPTRRRRCA